MEISYDPEKRATVLAKRGLDFDDAPQVFDGPTVRLLDDRRDYGEIRWVTYGHLDGRMIALVWTQRGNAKHIISMRKANERERQKYQGYLDRSG